MAYRMYRAPRSESELYGMWCVLGLSGAGCSGSRLWVRGVWGRGCLRLPGSCMGGACAAQGMKVPHMWGMLALGSFVRLSVSMWLRSVGAEVQRIMRHIGSRLLRA